MRGRLSIAIAVKKSQTPYARDSLLGSRLPVIV
jgi:hypothetical protein